MDPMDSPLVHIFAITMVVLLPVFAVTGATNFGKGHEPSLPPMVKQRPRNKSATKTIQKSLPAYGSPAGSSLYGSTSLSSTTSSMPRVTFPPEIEMQLNRLPPFQREVVRQMLVEKVMQGLRAGGMPGQGAPAQIPAPAPAAAPVPAPAYKFCIKCGGPMTLGICSVCGWKPAGGN